MAGVGQVNHGIGNVPSRRANLGSSLLQLAFAPRADKNFRSLPRVGLRDRLADTFAAARDQGDLPVQSFLSFERHLKTITIFTTARYCTVPEFLEHAGQPYLSLPAKANRRPLAVK
jgi:hypothetical protein